MGYNGSKDGKTGAFKSDMFPKRKFPKLVKGSSSLGKASLMPAMQEIEQFSSFFYGLLDICKDVRNHLIKKNVRIIYFLVLLDFALLLGLFIWKSIGCLIIGFILSFFLLANIWFLCLYLILLGFIIFYIT